MEHNMSDYLIHSGKLGMKWYRHDKDAYQTKSGNWVYGRNKPSERWNLKTEKTGSKTTSVDGKNGVSDIPDILDDAVKANVVGKLAEYSPSRNRNCVSCAIAYDLRRAGNKVQSIETVQGMSAFVVADIYKKTKSTDYVVSAKRTGAFKSLTKGMTDSEFDNMVNHLKSNGENTRGIVMVSWKSKSGENYSGGHAMNYEVKNGKFYLVDGQIGKVYDEQQARKQLSNAYDVMTLRTDNRRVNLDYANKYFVEPEGTKITAPSKGLRVANAVSKVGTGLAIGGVVANIPSFVLTAIHPAFFALGMGSTAAVIGGTYTTLASEIAADRIIQKNRKETAAKMVEKLTGNKVDRKTMAANVDKLLESIPEYNRVYNMTAGGKALSEDKIIPQLKTTDSDNAVNNTTNRNRAPIPVALPTGRNTNVGVSSQIRNTRSKKAVDKERENFVKKELARARRTGEYDMEFLERNLDIDPRTDKQYTPKAMEKAYAKYLNAEYLKRKSNSETKPAASPATKNTNVGVSSSKKGSMKSLYAKGVSIDEIAEKLGVSPSTVSKYVK
jgi:hypothetical protein